MTFRERLEPLLATGDTVAAWELLDSLTDEERPEARAWFDKSRRWLNDVWKLGPTGEDVDHDERRRRLEEAWWIVGLCALELCGPVTAARRVPWGWVSDYEPNPGPAMFVQKLWDKDPAWVATFTDEASRTSLGGSQRWGNHTLACVVRAAVVHHHLPCPTGDAFVHAWLAGTPVQARWDIRHQLGMSVEDWLPRDPLMPDVLLLRLASDAIGTDPELPDILPGLVERGVVTRDALLTTVFESLTRPRRPSTQKVLAACLTSLAVTPAEVPGGLAYLLGVLATSAGSVGNVLLPYAADLVATSDDLLELTRLVAGRPEKKHKRFVLGVLKDAATRERLGTGPVIEALRVLAEDDDAAFAEQVRRALAATPGAEPQRQEVVEASGLWALEPPVPADPRASFAWSSWERPPGWEVLGRGLRVEPHPTTVDRFVRIGLEGMYDDPAAWQALAHEGLGSVLGAGKPAISRIAGVLEAWFLAGGLRTSYPVGLWFAGECAARPRLPAGMADLLRLLSRYAVEVPADARPQVPETLRDLAARSGGTSAQVEARRLVDALEPGSPGAPGAVPEVVDLPAARGLWRDQPPAFGDDRETTVEDPFVACGDDPVALGDAMARWIGAPDSAYFLGRRHVTGPAGPGVSRHTEPFRSDQALAAIVHAASRYGVDPVRRALPHLRYTHLDPVVCAIELWLQGRLDAATYWRLSDPLISSFRLHLYWNEVPGLLPPQVGARLRAIPSLATQLDPAWSPDQVAEIPDLASLLEPARWGFTADLGDSAKPVLVVDAHLAAPGAQLTMARAAEALLGAESCPVLLSTPTRADVTVTFDDLLDRLRVAAEAGAEVGPLDLVQALHRLQPVSPDRATELDELRPVVTSATFEASESGCARDAVDLVRTWVTAGGLPDLEVEAVDGHWQTPTRAPVPFSTCRAAPDAVSRESWWLGWTETTARVVPGWPDRTCEHPFVDGPVQNGGHSGLSSRVPGTWAMPMHDAWWQALAHTRRDQYDDGDMASLRETLAPNRLVSEHLAAAAVGRHRARSLRLGRALVPLTVLCESGYLSVLWRPLLAVAGALAGESPRPTDLQALLRLLHSVAVEVPDPEPAPDDLRAFAASRGNTKAHLEARALVATLDSRCDRQVAG